MNNKLCLSDIDVEGKRCFVRTDFNVPLDEFQNITDDTRIRASLPTINHLIDSGAKIILASHLGRPKGKRNPLMSLKPVRARLSRLLKQEVKFVEECIGPEVDKEVADLKEGEVLLLENLRFYKEETDNDPEFSKKLASLADLYINDAFGSAHRAHASTEGITKFMKISACGFLMKKEIDYFHRAVSDPAHPVVAIVGGAKASTKIAVLLNLLEKVDKLIVGGGLAFTFLKARGREIGNNILEEEMLPDVRKIMDKAKERGVKFYLPVDFVVAEKIDPRAQTKVVTSQEIPENWVAPDIGPASVKLFSEALQDARTIIWNGPMGVFEMDIFSRGTMGIVSAVSNAYATTIVGGGDTDVAVHRAGAEDSISFISTGGGAFLELLEGKVLPALAALTDNPDKKH
ncbi:MAG: phosphoglycerate kinase [Nitrospinota bacterium]|nr:phosphoglycerate kinase [Nitrospinota bacterium]